MIKIAHRINTIGELKKIPCNYGVELDLRDYNGKIVITHDTFSGGDSFEDYLNFYNHELIILNIKCEGVEEHVSNMIRETDAKQYFYLDLSFPALIKLYRQGEKNIAVRFSEYEPIESCLALKDMVKWVWVDCFTDLPLNKKNYQILKKYFKICIVSPELQKHSVELINNYKERLMGFEIDAVCTKRPDLWE